MAGVLNNAPYLGPSGYVHVIHVFWPGGYAGQIRFRSQGTHVLSDLKAQYGAQVSGLTGRAFPVYLFDVAYHRLTVDNLCPAVNFSSFVKSGFTTTRLMNALSEHLNCRGRCRYGHDGHPAFHWVAFTPFN